MSVNSSYINNGFIRNIDIFLEIPASEEHEGHLEYYLRLGISGGGGDNKIIHRKSRGTTKSTNLTHEYVIPLHRQCFKI